MTEDEGNTVEITEVATALVLTMTSGADALQINRYTAPERRRCLQCRLRKTSQAFRSLITPGRRRRPVHLAAAEAQSSGDVVKEVQLNAEAPEAGSNVLVKVALEGNNRDSTTINGAAVEIVVAGSGGETTTSLRETEMHQSTSGLVG